MRSSAENQRLSDSPLTGDPPSKRGLRTKLARSMLLTLMLFGTVILSADAWMQVNTSKRNLKSLESQIHAALDSKGRILTENHAEKAWSNNGDSRNPWHDSSSDWPRDTMGVVSPNSGNWCTGTTFDSKLVLTAFHCFFNSSGNWVNLKFRAGQDGDDEPHPERNHVWKFWSQTFRDLDCHNTYTNACRPYDWAVMVLDNSPGASWMGYAWNSSDSTVSGWSKYHYGYPSCGEANAPDDCEDLTLFGQSFTCETASDDFFGSVGGWNRNFNHGCDMSGGHSGGPLYSNSPGSNGPYIVATNITEHPTCDSTSTCNSRPNRAFRIDSWLAGYLGTWRSQY